MSPGQPTFNISLPFMVSWVLIDNPTGSPILARFGGTDVPTEDSCDLFIPFACTLTAPVRARDFAFGFQTLAALGNPIPQKTATIVFGLAGEQPPTFGSLQQNKQQYYDRPSYKAVNTTYAISALFAGGASGKVFAADYVVPPRRKALLVSASLVIIRTIVAGAINPNPSYCALYYQPKSAVGPAILTASQAQLTANTPNLVGVFDRVVIPINLPLLAGDILNVFGQSYDTGGQVQCIADCIIQEFDA